MCGNAHFCLFVFICLFCLFVRGAEDNRRWIARESEGKRDWMAIEIAHLAHLCARFRLAHLTVRPALQLSFKDIGRTWSPGYATHPPTHLPHPCHSFHHYLLYHEFLTLLTTGAWSAHPASFAVVFASFQYRPSAFHENTATS